MVPLEVVAKIMNIMCFNVLVDIAYFSKRMCSFSRTQYFLFFSLTVYFGKIILDLVFTG